jgi:hypothetical protein
MLEIPDRFMMSCWCCNASFPIFCEKVMVELEPDRLIDDEPSPAS